MFRGENPVTLDAKGRLAMPSRYRERLKERGNGLLIATINRSDRSLLIYPMADWEETEKRIMALPSFDEANRRVQMLMVGHATELEMDAQGRILIPPNLREYAGLTRDAVLIGQANRFELWDEAAWKARRSGWQQVNEATAPMPPELKALLL
jgi:MraZ protein